MEWVSEMKWTAIACHIAVALALVSCTPMQWVDMRTGKPDGVEAALAACRVSARDEAWRSQWYLRWPPPFYQPYPRYPGWRRPFWSDLDLTEELYGRLVDFCMRSKGFRLVEVKEPESK